jgi:lipoprotein-anchoring transpeptidase ErfK/SrfK
VRVGITVVLAAALCAAAAASAPAASVQHVYQPGKLTYYAFVENATTAYSAADATSKKVTTLKTRTPDKTDELVLVLATTTDANGDEWYDVRLPIRPNGSTGWVKAADMSDLQPLSTWLKINTEKFTVTLIKNGKTVFHARAGVGQAKWFTPHGNFYVRDQLTGYGKKGSFYGPTAFATSATSDVLTEWPGGGYVGVHGTDEPNLIPGQISHGCVRLKNADILRLAKLMPVGTPVTIS